MNKDMLWHPFVRITCAVLLVTMIGACERPDDRPASGEDVVDDGDAPAPGPPLVITVKHGRSVEVDDTVYADSGVFRGRRANKSNGRAQVRIGPPGKDMLQVSMRATPNDSLVLVHVDASTSDDSTILVYGSYGSPTAGMDQASSDMVEAALFGIKSTKAPAADLAAWECKWCRDGILACGIEPRCR